MREKIVTWFTADSTDYERKVRSMRESTDKTSKSLSVGFAGAAAAVTTALGAAAVAVGAKSIQMASDMEETQGKFDVVFRGMGEQAEGWSKTLVNSYAMSSVESKKYLSNLQDLLVPTGLAREEAGKLSNQFVKMAADLGSFNNLPTEKVIEDIQSALQGSSETMAKYGINVKAAKVEQEIFNMGLASSKDEITDAHKAQAIYNIMMREGADAVGDMARTSDSFANQQKKALANVTDFTTELGQGLLPVATETITKFNQWYDANGEIMAQGIAEWVSETAIPAFSKLAGTIGNIATSMQGWAAVSDDSLGFFEFATMNAEELAGWLERDRLGLVDIENQIEVLADKRDRVAQSFAFTSSARKAKQEELAAIDTQIEALEQQHTVILSIAEVVEEDYTDSWVKANDAVVEATEQTTAKVEKSYETMTDRVDRELSRFFGEVEKKSEKTTELLIQNAEENRDKNIKAASKMTDMWLIHEQGKEDANRRALQMMEEDTDGYVSKTSNIFSSWASDLIDGQFSSVGDAWDSLWKGMLNTVTQTVADMAAKFVVESVVSKFFHDGVWDLEKDEYMATLQAGEMVIPRDQSMEIRGNIGEDGETFGALVEASKIYSEGRGVGNVGLDRAAQETTTPDIFGQSAYEDIGGFLGGVAGRAAVGYSTFGATPGAKSVGGFLGRVAGSMLGDMIGDLADDRDFESMRDAVEAGMLDPQAAQFNLAQIESLEDLSGKPSPQRQSKVGSAKEAFDQAVDDAVEGFKDIGRSIAEAFGIGGSTGTSTGTGGVHGGGPGADLGAAPGGDRQSSSGGYDFGATGRSEGDAGGGDSGGGGGQGRDRDSSPGGMGGLHGGMDYVPKETTYLLDRGERVLSPNQNKDLTEYLQGVKSAAGNITVNVQIGQQKLNAMIDKVIVERNRRSFPLTKRMYV